MRLPRFPAVLALVAARIVAAGAASAQPASPPQPAGNEKAERLYLEGKRLAAEGKVADACPMFEESQRLEPAIGTQFNLADCYEKTGRPARALALFREVSRVAQMSGKQERQRAADARIVDLDPRVPRIRIKVTSPSPQETIRCDGTEVASTALAKGVEVDPGEHVVEAAAPGYTPWETRVRVADSGAGVDVLVPALSPVPVQRVEVAAPAAPTSTLKPWVTPVGVALVGVGAIGIVVGSIQGLRAISNRDEAGCSGVDCSGAAPGSGDTLRDAQSAGTISTVGFVAGGILAAGGVALLLLGPRDLRPATGLRVTPGWASLVVEGSL
ncbi:MAG: tetratricopeptide repeat protein [Deltaproteobacteria bacterium]|nr:tetratricopeptide repeat protein [Deltaproteobacteria bacterium]